jgi:hypothetical protein
MSFHVHGCGGRVPLWVAAFMIVKRMSILKYMCFCKSFYNSRMQLCCVLFLQSQPCTPARVSGVTCYSRHLYCVAALPVVTTVRSSVQVMCHRALQCACYAVHLQMPFYKRPT